MSSVAVSAYQGETVYQIFMRAMFDRDIATGEICTLPPEEGSDKEYQSVGPADSLGFRNVLPPPPTFCSITGNYS